jgi:hypothetical protein
MALQNAHQKGNYTENVRKNTKLGKDIETE